MDVLKTADPEIWQAIHNEARRQQDGLEMIASENYASPAVMAAQGSVTRQDVRTETSKAKVVRPRPFVFAFRAPTKTFRLRMSFTKSKVDKSEIIEALENIIRELKAAR